MIAAEAPVGLSGDPYMPILLQMGNRMYKKKKYPRISNHGYNHIHKNNDSYKS